MSVPSYSSPNHLFAQSATSCGVHDNIMYSDCGGPTDTYPQLTICERATVATAFLSLPCRLCFQVPIALVLLCRPFADERCCDRRRQHVPAQPIVRDLYELDVRHRLCLVFPPSSRLRHRLCLVCLHRLRGEDTRLCLVCSTVFVAKTMIFCVSTVFVAKTPPLPCVFTSSLWRRYPPLPRVFHRLRG